MTPELVVKHSNNIKRACTVLLEIKHSESLGSRALIGMATTEEAHLLKCKTSRWMSSKAGTGDLGGGRLEGTAWTRKSGNDPCTNGSAAGSTA